MPTMPWSAGVCPFISEGAGYLLDIVRLSPRVTGYRIVRKTLLIGQMGSRKRPKLSVHRGQ